MCKSSLCICFIKHKISNTSFTVLLTAKSLTFTFIGNVSDSASCIDEAINIFKSCAKFERIVAVLFISSPFPIFSVSVFKVS